jgi:hypothetical protein
MQEKAMLQIQHRLLVPLCALLCALLPGSFPSQAAEQRASDAEVLRNALRALIPAEQAYYAATGRYGTVQELQAGAEVPGSQGRIIPFLNTDFCEVIAQHQGRLFMWVEPVGGQSFKALVVYSGPDPLCYVADESGLIMTITAIADLQPDSAVGAPAG